METATETIVVYTPNGVYEVETRRAISEMCLRSPRLAHLAGYRVAVSDGTPIRRSSTGRTWVTATVPTGAVKTKRR